MTNMSYCAFENTVDDMNQCIEKLKEHDYDLELCREVAENTSGDE
jgi:hypothetical protein